MQKGIFFPWLALGKIVDYDGVYVSDLNTNCDSVANWSHDLGQGY